MKAFEKQFGKLDDVINNWDEYNTYEGAEEGWKAALEWVLEQGDKSHWVNELSGVIREELEQ